MYRKSSNTFHVQLTFSENRAFCEIMSKNMVQSDRPQIKTQRRACASHAGQVRSHACAHIRTRPHVRAPTHTRTRYMHARTTHKYVLLITFPWQPFFPERASIMRYTHIASLVFKKKILFSSGR